MAPDMTQFCPRCGAYHPGENHAQERDPDRVRIIHYVQTQTGETPWQAYRRQNR